MRDEFSHVQIQTVHDQVRQFMRRDYLDIRIEIVDHILNLIGEDQLSNPQHQFYSSLNDAIESLGGHKGIREIEFSRKYELWRQYLLGHSRAFKDAFRMPQILFSLLVIGLMYISIDYENIILWIFLSLCCLTGLVEILDRWGSRGWVNDRGDTLTSFKIYSRSAFVTNMPLLFLIPPMHQMINPVMSQLVVSVSLYTYVLFFVLRFYYLRNGIRSDIMKYREMGIS